MFGLFFWGSLCLLVVYILLFLAFWVAWRGFSRTPSRDVILVSPRVTIIVPFRDEEDALPRLLEAIRHQKYPAGCMELLLVNDHSRTRPAFLYPAISEFPFNCRLIVLGEGSFGKKAAIREGVLAATGDYILTTDADCQLHPGWVECMVRRAVTDDLTMCFGPVVIEPTSVFTRWQSLEFMSLVGSGAGAAGLGRPIMCNGANLLFRVQAYLDYLPVLVEDKYASGDDVMFMLHLKKKGEKIGFNKQPEAIVVTRGEGNILSFLIQRLRWTSKSRGYRDFDVIAVALVVANTSLVIVSWSLYGFSDRIGFAVFLGFLILKSLPDYLLLRDVSGWFRQKKLLAWFIPVQVVYPFYIVLVALLGNILKVKWKGRPAR